MLCFLCTEWYGNIERRQLEEGGTSTTPRKWKMHTVQWWERRWVSAKQQNTSESTRSHFRGEHLGRYLSMPMLNTTPLWLLLKRMSWLSASCSWPDGVGECWWGQGHSAGVCESTWHQHPICWLETLSSTCEMQLLRKRPLLPRDKEEVEAEVEAEVLRHRIFPSKGYEPSDRW